MGFPFPLVTGSFVFILLGIAAGAFGLWLKRNRGMSKDNGQIYCTSVIIGVFCMWLMWVCTWMHQWHPLILPMRGLTQEVDSMPDPSIVGAAAASTGGHRML